MEIQALIQETEKQLEKGNIPSARLEAEVLLAHSLGIERIDLYKSPERKLGGEALHQFRNVVAGRLGGIPTAYLRGKKEFFSRVFKVGTGVLIPRAETELLVEEGLRRIQKIKSPTLLELGTGSAAVVVSLLAEHPDAQAVATDRSATALAYAKENASAYKVSGRIRFLEGNWFEPIAKEERFDLIVSNPPYIPTNEISEDLRFEPREALDGGPDGLLSYREILDQAWKSLKPSGHLILEIGGTNRQLIEAELAKRPGKYGPPVFKKDLAGHDRLLTLAGTML